MTTRDNIQALTQQIDRMKKQVDELQESSWQLRQDRRQLQIQVIREEKMLRDTQWQVKSDEYGLRLILAHRPMSSELEQVAEMMQTDYHCSIELEKGVNLRFDDSRVAITFEDSKDILPFLRDYQLEVITLGIRDEIDKRQQEISDLGVILHLVGKSARHD